MCSIEETVQPPEWWGGASTVSVNGINHAGNYTTLVSSVSTAEVQFMAKGLRVSDSFYPWHVVTRVSKES